MGWEVSHLYWHRGLQQAAENYQVKKYSFGTVGVITNGEKHTHSGSLFIVFSPMLCINNILHALLC